MPQCTKSEQTIVQSHGSRTDQPHETRTNNESHHSELNTSVDFHDLEESMKSRLIELVFFFSYSFSRTRGLWRLGIAEMAKSLESEAEG